MKNIVYIVILLISYPVTAIQIDSVNTFMAPNKNVVSQKVSNPSSTAHLVTIKVQRIDSPYTGKVVSVPHSEVQELTFTPERILQPAGSSNFVKFYYNGPRDDKERYYKVTWVDDPLSLKNQDSDKKAASLHAVASVGTILVIKPRLSHLKYSYRKSKLINTGNVSFRMVAYGPCSNKNSKHKECHSDGPIAPGGTFEFNKINMNSKNAHLGIWENKVLVPVDIHV
ncbi:EcpB family pilus assembly chaperone [Aeromonas lacus]